MKHPFWGPTIFGNTQKHFKSMKLEPGRNNTWSMELWRCLENIRHLKIWWVSLEYTTILDYSPHFWVEECFVETRPISEGKEVKKIPFGFLVQIRIREKVGNFASQPMSGWVSVLKRGYAEKVGGSFPVVFFYKHFFFHHFLKKTLGGFQNPDCLSSKEGFFVEFGGWLVSPQVSTFVAKKIPIGWSPSGLGGVPRGSSDEQESFRLGSGRATAVECSCLAGREVCG